MYGNGILSESSDAFPTWAVCLKNMVEAPDRARNVWIIRAIFNTKRFINRPGRLLSAMERKYQRKDLQM